MTKEPTKNVQQKLRERLLKIIDETSPEELMNGRSLIDCCYVLEDGSGSYCIYQHNGGRWSFSKGEKRLFAVNDDQLVDIFTHKVGQFIKEQTERGIYDEGGLNGI